MPTAKKPPLRFRLLAKLLTFNDNWLANKLLQRAYNTPYWHLKDNKTGEIYMYRWWLFNPDEPIKDDAGVQVGIQKKYDWTHVGIRFHRIMRADDARHHHNHPWPFISIILDGWYAEERYDDEGKTLTVYGPGSINQVTPEQYHRIIEVAPEGVLTLVFTGEYTGKPWGFDVYGQHVPWRQYLNIPDPDYDQKQQAAAEAHVMKTGTAKPTE